MNTRVPSRLVLHICFQAFEKLFHQLFWRTFSNRDICLRPDFVRVFVRQLLEGGVVRALVYLELVSLVLFSALDDLLTIVQARSNLLVVRAKLGRCRPSTRGAFAIRYLLYSGWAL